MTLLFSPLTLRETTFRNRLWVSPCACTAPSTAYRRNGTIPTSPSSPPAVPVSSSPRPPRSCRRTHLPRDTGLWNDAQRDAWAPIVRAIHDRGALAGVQLAHAGRKASTWWPFADGRGSVPAEDGGWTTVAPRPWPSTD
ncbi:hypothetical protein [Microbacterium sp. NIBRBAC000506063]|uniref:oxidoreductase n=1 Tax=Microbacterium sp. NIBRBAC000506063 TaxID=2734618 RepID=UPI0021D41DBB|nr:hypothetical protein [Microbacterium sp. NIBRBAC000506063]